MRDRLSAQVSELSRFHKRDDLPTIRSELLGGGVGSGSGDLLGGSRSNGGLGGSRRNRGRERERERRSGERERFSVDLARGNRERRNTERHAGMVEMRRGQGPLGSSSMGMSTVEGRRRRVVMSSILLGDVVNNDGPVLGMVGVSTILRRWRRWVRVGSISGRRRRMSGVELCANPKEQVTM